VKKKATDTQQQQQKTTKKHKKHCQSGRTSYQQRYKLLVDGIAHTTLFTK